MADTLLQSRGLSTIRWGGSALDRPGDLRNRYLLALRAADRGDYRTLLALTEPAV